MEFHIKTENVETLRGTWSHIKVKIYQKETQIGEYSRDYHAMFKTFVPFIQNGKWFALYSKNYEESRVMELPSCNDLSGEKSRFCPVEYYVPQYDDFLGKDNTEKTRQHFKAIEGTFGFVSGCHWGDDSSSKIGFIDLKNITEGKLELSPYKFGYLEKPQNFSLKECINLFIHTPEPALEDIQLNITHSDLFKII